MLLPRGGSLRCRRREEEARRSLWQRRRGEESVTSTSCFPSCPVDLFLRTLQRISLFCRLVAPLLASFSFLLLPFVALFFLVSFSLSTTAMVEEEQKPLLLSMGSDAEEEAERQVCVCVRIYIERGVFSALSTTTTRR